MKAILIARVSTEEQKEAGNSLPAQVVRLESYCKNRGFEILKICSFDESAYKNDREEFDQIIDFILEQQEKVAVCCDKVDRISRNIFDTRISKLYEKALCDEIELHFASEGQVINSRISAVEKFQFSISLGLAKYYSDAISDNVRRAHEQKLRKGEWLSKAPMGYKNITNEQGNTDIIVDEKTSHIVIKAFELYATGAYSMELLSKKLNDEHGCSFHKGNLSKVLKNPFYYGIMKVKGQLYPHRYPPLITQDLFNQAQQFKETFNKQPFKYAGKPYIYRGLMRCAHCGLSITPEQHKGHVYYHCTQYNGKHGAKWLREEEITEQLGLVFKNMKMPEEIIHQILDTLNAVHEEKIKFHNKHFDKLTKEQKNLTRMMDNLYRDKLQGRITDSMYDRYEESFRDELADVTLKLEQLQGAEDNYYITAKYVLNLLNRAYDLFKSSEVDERRQLIKLVLQNLRIEDEKLLYDVQKPFDLIVKNGDRKLWRG